MPGVLGRRSVLELAAAPVALAAAPVVRTGRRRVVVVGAGAFGGWTALWLARRGARVPAPPPDRRPVAPLLGGESASTRTRRTATSSSTAIRGRRNVWILGGGSGHGFKMGPALDELAEGLVLDDTAPDPAFSLRPFRPAR
jgi:glycine/D-amino acid oxidase-like deaminating enzyme